MKKSTLLAVSCLMLLVPALGNVSEEAEDIPDFYEVDVRKVNTKSPVEFGISMYSNDYDAYVINSI